MFFSAICPVCECVCVVRDGCFHDVLPGSSCFFKMQRAKWSDLKKKKKSRLLGGAYLQRCNRLRLQNKRGFYRGLRISSLKSLPTLCNPVARQRKAPALIAATSLRRFKSVVPWIVLCILLIMHLYCEHSVEHSLRGTLYTVVERGEKKHELYKITTRSKSLITRSHRLRAEVGANNSLW